MLDPDHYSQARIGFNMLRKAIEDSKRDIKPCLGKVDEPELSKLTEAYANLTRIENLHLMKIDDLLTRSFEPTP